METVNDYIRSFGMSGMLISDEIKELESKYSLNLGHTTGTNTPSTIDQYTQFEQVVRSEASEMAMHYELFYCLEKSIRKLIAETLQESDGATWWKSSKVPQNIQNEVADRIQRELDSGVTSRSEEQLDYTTFGELSVIISSNWAQFGLIFKSRKAVEKILTSLNVLRGPIAHCCMINDDEVQRLRLAIKDWFRNIG